MARKPIQMNKIRELIRLRLDRDASLSEIACACDISRTTASEYCARIRASGLSWPCAVDLSDDDLHGILFPAEENSAASMRGLPDFAEIRREMTRKGVTLKLLWQEYKAVNPRGCSYSRFARHYAQWRKNSDLRMIQHHKAGQKMFADWAGLKMEITDPGTGEVWQAPVFVSALGASQYLFAKLYESEELKWWLRAHVEAFEDLGAVPEIVVPDNLKTGVQKPCRYEPALNPSYAELARFYGVAVIPARPYKPRDKAKVENGVQQVERWALAPLRDRTFFSLGEANEALQEKIREINEKIMKGPNRSRKELFELEDRPAMRPLPESRYEYAEWKRFKVGPDYHVLIEGRPYSVPFTLCGKHVDVRIASSVVEVFHLSGRVASHIRSIGGRAPKTNPEHMPEGHKEQAAWTPARMIRWAASIGPNAADFAQGLLEGKVHPEHGFRMCMGVISLAKRYGPTRVEAACARALSLGAMSYRTVKHMLEKGLEAAPIQSELPALPTHDNVRGGSYYSSQEATCAKSR